MKWKEQEEINITLRKEVKKQMTVALEKVKKLAVMEEEKEKNLLILYKTQNGRECKTGVIKHHEDRRS